MALLGNFLHSLRSDTKGQSSKIVIFCFTKITGHGLTSGHNITIDILYHIQKGQSLNNHAFKS